MNDLTTKEEGKPTDLIASAFDKMGQNFEELLPSHVTPQRFKQVVMTAVSSSPDLLAVSMTAGGRRSIIMSALKCASDGLVPDGREAALVPFNCKVSKKGEPDRWEKQAQYLPMVRGIVTKMQQSPNCKEIGVNLVHKNDLLDYAETDQGTEFTHKPVLFGDKGELIGVYAFVRTFDGGFYMASVDKEELEKIEQSSKAGNSPWKGPFKSEMQKKSALKRLAKIAPVSRDVQALIDHDNETFHEIQNAPEKPSMLKRLQSQKQSGLIEAPPADELPATDEPEPMTGELMEALPPEPEDLPDPCSQKQAIAYAEVWAARYKALDKAGRDAFYNATETDADRATKTASKALDLISDAINSPPVE